MINQALTKHFKRLKLANSKPFNDSAFIEYKDNKYLIMVSYNSNACRLNIYKTVNGLKGDLVKNKQDIECIVRFNREVVKRLFREGR